MSKRLLVSLDEKIFTEIQNLAKLSHVSLSKMAGNLILNSLELEEDVRFSKLADHRNANTEKWLSHEEIWK